MGGPRLTPQQLETAAEVFARTNNLSEAARAIHVNESTLRSAFERERIARNREAHARACEEGLQEGLTFLMDVARTCHGVMKGEVKAGEGLLAADFASLGRVVNQALATVAGLSERDEKRRQAVLTRRKTRAEIRALEKDTKPTTEQLLAALASLSRDELLALIAQRKATSQPDTSTGAT